MISLTTSVLIAAFLSFVLSVSLWFFADDAKLEAIFVGIWVPSIISLGSALERKLDE